MDAESREKRSADALERTHRVRAALAESEEARAEALELCRRPEVDAGDRAKMFAVLGNLDASIASLRGALTELEQTVEALTDPAGDA